MATSLLWIVDWKSYEEQVQTNPSKTWLQMRKRLQNSHPQPRCPSSTTAARGHHHLNELWYLKCTLLSTECTSSSPLALLSCSLCQWIALLSIPLHSPNPRGYHWRLDPCLQPTESWVSTYEGSINSVFPCLNILPLLMSGTLLFLAEFTVIGCQFIFHRAARVIFLKMQFYHVSLL